MSAVQLQQTLHDRGFEVSKRQVLRDLEVLSGIFPLLCNDKGQPYGWRWSDGAACDIPGITTAEALSLVLAEEAIRPFLPPALSRVMQPQFDLAKKKLQTLGPGHPLSRWQDKIASVPPTMPLLPPNINPEILSRIQNAVLQEKQVEVDYQRLTAEKAEPLILHPLGLILRGNIMYLIATAYDYDDVRLYALHRMRQVMLREETINPPTDFVLSDYLEAGNGHFRSETGDIRLEVQVSKELGHLLMETPLSLDQAIEPHAEGYRLFATVPHTWQLEWWILSQAERIVVIAPKQLSDRIRSILASSLSQIKNQI
jgi:predicted DNA-binding transcriptional regulator YafY